MPFHTAPTAGDELQADRLGTPGLLSGLPREPCESDYPQQQIGEPSGQAATLIWVLCKL